MGRAHVSFRAGGASSRTRVRGLIGGLILALVASSGPARGQAARPAARDALNAPLARFVPRRDLIFFLEFGGLNAHAHTWRASAAYKLLNDTKLGELLEDLAAQGIDLAQQSAPGEKRIKGSAIVEGIERVARDGFAIAVWGKAPDDSRVLVVARHGGRPEVRGLLESIVTASAGDGGEEKAQPAPIQRAGRTLQPLGKDGVWWVEKGDLILTGRDQAEEVLAVLDGKQPSAVDHPLRAELAKGEGGFEVAAIGFLDIAALPPMPPEAVQLGLDGLKRIELQWGFQDDALRTVLRAVAPAPRRGLLALLDQPTFDLRSLPPMPAALHGFTVLSVDLARTYDRITALVKTANPQEADQVATTEKALRQQFGLDLKDLLSTLGPKLAVYVQPPADGAGANRAATLITQFSGLTVASQVRDEAALTRAIDPLMKMVNHLLGEAQARGRNPANAGGAPLGFRKQDGPRPTYVLELPPGSLPPPFAAMFRPTILLAKDQLILAASTTAAERVADVSGDRPAGRWEPAGAYLPVVRRLPASMAYLNISDPRDTMPAMIEALLILAHQINAQAVQARRLGPPRAGVPPPGVPLLRMTPTSSPAPRS